ncbi:MAG: hypothetical protein NT027_04150, partial [Proteobacteria bacterium]|nr:hypothetical protein [Pseudomonadota bacterium]
MHCCFFRLAFIYPLAFSCQIVLAKVGFIPKCPGPVTIKDQISAFAVHQNGRLAFSSSEAGENYFIDIKQSNIARKANFDGARSATFHPTKPILFWVSSIDSNLHKYNLSKNDTANTINQNDLPTSKDKPNDVLFEDIEISGDIGVLPMNQDVLYGISSDGLF